jgi:hypothetical protein
MGVVATNGSIAAKPTPRHKVAALRAVGSPGQSYYFVGLATFLPKWKLGPTAAR